VARHRIYLAQQRPQIFAPCDSDKLEILRQPHIGKRLQAMLVKVQEAATAAIKASQRGRACKAYKSKGRRGLASPPE
jgi:hypothetical protein